MKWSTSCTALSAPFKTSFSEPDQAFAHPRWGLVHKLSVPAPSTGKPVSHPTPARFHSHKNYHGHIQICNIYRAIHYKFVIFFGFADTEKIHNILKFYYSCNSDGWHNNCSIAPYTANRIRRNPKRRCHNTKQNAAEMLNRGRKRLIRELPKHTAMDFMHHMAGLVDEYFRTSFETSAIGPRMDIARNPYAIIALGGYGRNDQCVHSDVDLLILFEKRVPDTAEGLIREIIYPLWDIGLDVGHATRSLKECLSLAGKDFEILTPLLDARFVCGMSRLYTALTQQLRQKVVERHSRKIIDWLVETNQSRHARFGDSAYLLEPNLKEGQGGLRDFHTMRWIACIRSGLKQIRDLEYLGYLSHEEYEQLKEALAFIANVRNRLHLLNGRKYDQLHFENQLRIAKALGYSKENGQQPVERFLGDLHGQMEFIKQQHLMFLFEQGYEKRSRRRKRRSKITKIAGIKSSRTPSISSPPAWCRNPPCCCFRYLRKAPGCACL